MFFHPVLASGPVPVLFYLNVPLPFSVFPAGFFAVLVDTTVLSFDVAVAPTAVSGVPVAVAFVPIAVFPLFVEVFAVPPEGFELPVELAFFLPEDVVLSVEAIFVPNLVFSRSAEGVVASVVEYAV